jgi:hypothetical protein
MKEYNVIKKLFRITTDNASNGTKAVKLFSNAVGLESAGNRCIAHFLNLACQDGLAEINDVLFKIRYYAKTLQDPRMRSKF